jgi:hypothetical protein
MSTANTTRDALTDLRSTLEKMGGQFKAVMPTQQHVDRFIRVVMTAVQGESCSCSKPTANRSTRRA